MTELDDIDRDEKVYSIEGIVPADDDYSFTITLDDRFANVMQYVKAPEKQQSIKEHIVEGILDHAMADVRFHGDTLLISNITVYHDATGLDHGDTDYGGHKYYPHNIDTSGEAIEVIAAFTKWVELAKIAADLELKEDDNA